MICQTFKKLSAQVWNDIRKSRRAGFQLKEETLTDRVLLELKLKHRQDVAIKVFNKAEEGRTGADWEWWFTDSKNWIGFRLQAKTIDIDKHGFSHLHYRNRNGVHQSQILVENALHRGNVKLMPLYCLYTHVGRSTFTRANPYCNEDPKVWGCSLVSAIDVFGLRYENRHHILELANYMHPWHTLVCSASFNESMGRVKSMDEHVVREFCRYNTLGEPAFGFPKSFVTRIPPAYAASMLPGSDYVSEAEIGLKGSNLYDTGDSPDENIEGVVVFKLDAERGE